jgi:NADPH2:quinone reductase
MQPHGPFWLILDSLGGSALVAALGMLQPGGTRVTFGVSDAAQATFESHDFFATGGSRLYGLTLFHELMSVERAGIGLALLADLIAAKEVTAANCGRGTMERDRHGRPSADRSRVRWQAVLHVR